MGLFFFAALLRQYNKLKREKVYLFHFNSLHWCNNAAKKNRPNILDTSPPHSKHIIFIVFRIPYFATFIGFCSFLSLISFIKSLSSHTTLSIAHTPSTPIVISPPPLPTYKSNYIDCILILLLNDRNFKVFVHIT